MGVGARWGLGLACVVGCAPAPSTAPAASSWHELKGEAFGTSWTVKWAGPTPSAADAEAAIVSALDQVDQRMSSWRKDSEINAIRAHEGPLVVSAETFEVVDASLDLAAATRGAFDPTVEPLMALWGFRGERRATPPTDEDVAGTLERVGFAKVHLQWTDAGPTVDAGGTALDLSAIAKGHGVDRVSDVLSALGATQHLVEIGGEVRAHGTGPRGDWRLGVELPRDNVAPGTQFAAFVGLRNASLATSGNYRNAYDVDGNRVVHTMDPRTGRPHRSEVASVTVIAPDCRTADGWATALMVLSPEEGLAAVEARPQLDALLLVAGPDGFVERRSGGMSRWLIDP